MKRWLIIMLILVLALTGVMGACAPSGVMTPPEDSAILPEEEELTPASPCPRGSPPPETTYYLPNKSWDKVPSITISAQANDSRVQLAMEAVDYWNEQLAAIGTPFRLGPVTHTTILVPVDYIEELFSALEARETRPEPPVDIEGDIIIVLSDGIFISYATYPKPGECVWVCIRSSNSEPLSLTNVTRNVIAHELGHAIGLGHNNDPTKLMCGRPAECRPPDYECDVEQFFPITEEEKAYLLYYYPTDWGPVQ